ncbi:hypothetical protein B7Z00_02590 [Candidatus Saccharibacteria bacterium 32-50-10]|nr:MAG: hypothetical protein B7Z00_02590 [Candidatus Saccharibacteria bacterium 32-50-10]
MPRRNKQPTLRRTPPTHSAERSKVRYATKQQAMAAAKDRMLYHPDLELSVYQSPADGGWYLTSSATASPSSRSRD